MVTGLFPENHGMVMNRMYDQEVSALNTAFYNNNNNLNAILLMY